MTPEKFDGLLAETIEETVRTLQSKADEYATGKDRLKNFKDISDFLDGSVSPLMVAQVLVAKHIIALKDFVLRREMFQPVTVEQFREKTGDIIAYMPLMRALYLESIEQEEQVKGAK